MAFPKTFYHQDGTSATVTTQNAQDALAGGWFETPEAYGLITSPSLDQMTDPNYVAAPTAYAPNAIQYAPQGIVFLGDPA